MNADENTLIYVIEGDVNVGNSDKKITENNLGILEQGQLLSVTSLTESARFLVISARPLNEPVVRVGPFVMNTEAEVRLAVSDFKNNRF